MKPSALAAKIDTDRTYILSYVYNEDFSNQRTIEFSGAEIHETLNMLPEDIFDDGGAETFKEMLKTNIIVGGRLLLDKPLSDHHTQETFEIVEAAQKGIEFAHSKVRTGFATYLGLNIDKIGQQESDAWKLGLNYKKCTFFVFDTEYSGDLPEISDEALLDGAFAEANEMMESYKVRQHPPRQNTSATHHIV